MATDLLQYFNERAFALVDFTALPAPDIVETPTFLQIRRELVEKFVSLKPEYRLLLESDPVAKVIEVWAYREMILRERINSAARANLLALASGTDLDHLAAFYGVERMIVAAADPSTIPPTPAIYENDESLRFRTQTRILAWANAGGVDHYKYWAMTASPDVLDAAVYSPDHPNGYNMGGHVAISVLGRAGNHIPSLDTLTAVRNVVTAPNVKVVTDIVTVEPAVMRTIDLTVHVYLMPRTPISVFNALPVRLLDAFNAQQRLGWDVTRSWLFQKLHVDGVHSIDILAPTANIVVPPNEFPSLGTVSILFKGFSDTEADNVSAMERQRLIRLMYETYIAFAVERSRTAEQMVADLAYEEKDGVIQPTMIGLVRHLGITNIYKADRVTLLDEPELADLVFALISPRYATLV